MLSVALSGNESSPFRTAFNGVDAKVPELWYRIFSGMCCIVTELLVPTAFGPGILVVGSEARIWPVRGYVGRFADKMI